MPVRHSWDAPECPDCESDVFVRRFGGLHDWICEACGGQFDADYEREF